MRSRRVRERFCQPDGVIATRLCHPLGEDGDMQRFRWHALVLAVLCSASGAAQDGPAFEVASIKRSAPAPHQSSGFLPTPGRFTAVDVPASALLGLAFRAEIDEMRGAPGWSTKEHYDITAPYPAGTAPDRVALMLRNLLVDRFHLVTHVEQESRDVLSLVLAQPGAPHTGLRAVDVDCDVLAAAQRGPVPPPPSPTAEMPPCRAVDGGRLIRSGGMPLTYLTTRLRLDVGRQVVDDTGLTGAFAFDLKFSPNKPGWPEPTDEYPELVTALRDQLGLKLIPKKATVKILVVDRFERPTEN
jgi:uncharacterized protein (TIGR03435 family)